jgi:TldD protein
VEALLLDLVDKASGRAAYADARYVQVRDETLAVRNGELATLDVSEDAGIGVRVRIGGRWGFAATREPEPSHAEAALARALAVAHAQPAVAERPLAPEPAARGAYSSTLEIDPFEVPLERKLALLSSAEAKLRGDPGVTVGLAHVRSHREEKVFVSSAGSVCRQRITECGGGLEATAIGAGGLQVRSYPGSHSGNVAQAGWEHVLGLDLEAHAPRVGAEAAALLAAPPCPAARTTLVLAGEQLAMQLHESVGHAVELDRVLGYEASYAGTSWVPAADLGSLRYGSEQMNVTADATLPGGLGSFRWDDEGVDAQALPVVRNGVLQAFLSSRESAAEIGLARSGGCTSSSPARRRGRSSTDSSAGCSAIRSTPASLRGSGPGSTPSARGPSGDRRR